MMTESEYDEETTVEATKRLSTAEAAERLGLSTAILYKYIGAGKLHPQVEGQSVWLEIEEVESFFEELARDKGSFAGSLESLHGKVRELLRQYPGVELDEKPDETAATLARDFLRLAAAQSWQSFTLSPREESILIHIETEKASSEFAILETVLAKEISHELVSLAGLITTEAAARAEFLFEADERKTEFRAARAETPKGEHLHFVRLEEDHPDFDKIWKASDADTQTIVTQLDKADGLYLLYSPRDLGGEAHMLSLAKKLCPENATGILLTRGQASHGGFLTPIHYGDDETGPSLDDGIKTIFALGTKLCVFPEIRTPEELRAALEISHAGIPVVAFCSNLSFSESLCHWTEEWKIERSLLEQALSLAVERKIRQGETIYRITTAIES